MLRFETFVGAPPPGWDADLQAIDGTVFHSVAWAGFQHSVQGGEPIFIRALDESGATVGAVLALFRRSRYPILSTVLRWMETASYPIAAMGNPDLVRRLIQETERVARKLGCARLMMGSNFSGGVQVSLADLGYTTEDRVEFMVDLTASEDALWNAIKKDQRDRIRRLARDGVEYEATRQVDAMKALSMIQQTALERRLGRDQGFSLPDDPTYYAVLHRTLVEPGSALLLLARQRGEPVAAIFYATFAGKAYSIFSGSTEAGYKSSAQSGLFWYAVTTFKKEGFLVLDRGGVPAASSEEGHELHGIFRFKHRLGTTPVRCVSGVRVISPVKQRVAMLREVFR